MAFVRVYRGLALNGTASPQNPSTNVGMASAGVPCRGARQVVVRYRATNNAAPSAITVFGANAQARVGTAWLNLTGLGFTQNQNLAQNPSQDGGLTSVMSASGPHRYWLDFVQVSLTTNATTAPTNQVVDIEVYYDSDADNAVAEQLGTKDFTPQTT